MKRLPRRSGQQHRHRAVSKYALQQVDGLPYEVERTVCRECGRILAERTIRLTAA